MLSPEIAQLRELIAARIHAADCDCADFASPRCELRMAGTYRAIADSVLELFPDVQHVRCLPAHAKAGEPWARFVLRTAPEPIRAEPA